MKKFNYRYAANLDTTEKRIKYIEERKNITNFSWERFAKNYDYKLNEQLITHFKEEIPESVWRTLHVHKPERFSEAFIKKYFFNTAFPATLVSCRPNYSDAFLEIMERHLCFTRIARSSCLTPKQIEKYFFKINFSVAVQANNYALIQNIPKELFLDNLEFLSKTLDKKALGKIAFKILTEEEFLQHSESFSVSSIRPEELEEGKLVERYKAELKATNALSWVIPASKKFVEKNLEDFDYYIRTGAYLTKLKETNDEKLYDDLEYEVGLLSRRKQPINFLFSVRHLFNSVYMRPSLAKNLVKLTIDRQLAGSNTVYDLLSLLYEHPITPEDMLSLETPFRKEDIILGLFSSRTLHPEFIKQYIDCIDIDCNSEVAKNLTNEKRERIFTQINDKKEFERLLSNPNSLLGDILVTQATALPLISNDRHFIRYYMELWSDPEGILKLFDEYLQDALVKKIYLRYKEVYKKFLLASVKMAGPRFRQIYIDSLAPNKIKIGCTYFKKDEAIAAISEKYFRHTATRDQYISCVEECFKKAEEVKKNL